MCWLRLRVLSQRHDGTACGVRELDVEAEAGARGTLQGLSRCSTWVLQTLVAHGGQQYERNAGALALAAGYVLSGVLLAHLRLGSAPRLLTGEVLYHSFVDVYSPGLLSHSRRAGGGGARVRG